MEVDSTGSNKRKFEEGSKGPSKEKRSRSDTPPRKDKRTEKYKFSQKPCRSAGCRWPCWVDGTGEPRGGYCCILCRDTVREWAFGSGEWHLVSHDTGCTSVNGAQQVQPLVKIHEFD